MKEYSIKITYSWGDEEEPYGKYPSKDEAFKAMCTIAAREAYVQNEEGEIGRTCILMFDAAKGAIDLHYDYDNTWCYYRVIEADSKNEPREAQSV